MEINAASGKKGAATFINNKQFRRKALRAVIQILFFFSMPSAFVAGFNGIKDVFTRIGQGNPLEMNSFVLVLLAMIIFTMIFGRFFCGYVCAFGTAVDLFGFLGGLIEKYFFKRRKKYTLPEKAIRILQKLKYVNLVFIIILCTSGSYKSLTGNSVWNVFSRITELASIPEAYTIGTVLLIIVFVLCMIQERFFCQFLCPMGAVLALLPSLPIGRLKRKEENCIKGCNACKAKCPAKIKLGLEGHRDGECINCGKCIGTCRRENIRYGSVWKSDILPVMLRSAIFFVLGILLGICRIGR